MTHPASPALARLSSNILAALQAARVALVQLGPDERRMIEHVAGQLEVLSAAVAHHPAAGVPCPPGSYVDNGEVVCPGDGQWTPDEARRHGVDQFLRSPELAVLEEVDDSELEENDEEPAGLLGDGKVGEEKVGEEKVGSAATPPTPGAADITGT